MFGAAQVAEYLEMTVLCSEGAGELVPRTLVITILCAAQIPENVYVTVRSSVVATVLVP